MKSLHTILMVPEDEALRQSLHTEARLLVEREKLLPPAKLETLALLADELVKRCSIPASYAGFITVLLGNETWRKTVRATPPSRRLLLLPQCMKDTVQCKGVLDDLGLNCAGCKACHIDNILSEAEELGYATLVAEGTTVAVSLVEEGAVDAILGVSCMPVLQRSFEPASNAAIPVIGLPLMYDGCNNTKMDTGWLLDEIRQYAEDRDHQPLSVSMLKSRIQHYFTGEVIQDYIPGTDQTEQLAIEYLLIDGQRMRPLLSALSYLAYSGKDREAILKPLALIIECFHKASLIHDDIEDDSKTRYNTETAHMKYGLAQAINTGDYLIGKGYEILSHLPLESGVMAESLKAVSASHVKLTLGQGSDLLFNAGQKAIEIEEVLQIFKLKTGEAIKVALLLGAIIGGADETERDTIKRFSDFFGISYQIRDDLNEFSERNSDEKPSDFPFLIALLDSAFSKNGDARPIDFMTDASEFRKTIMAKNLEHEARMHLENYVRKCYTELDTLINTKLRLSLYRILGKLFKPMTANE